MEREVFGIIAHTLSHTLGHTRHVSGLGEETEVPGAEPRGTRRTCKLHAHRTEVIIEPLTLEVGDTPKPLSHGKALL